METIYSGLSVVFERCMTEFYHDHSNDIDSLFRDVPWEIAQFSNVLKKPSLNELCIAFLNSFRPLFYEFLRETRPMTDLGALFYSLSSNLTVLTGSVIKYAPGNQRSMFIDQELKFGLIRECEHLLSDFKSLPEIVREWPKFGGWEQVNEIISHYKHTYTEKRSSWPVDAIVCAAEDDWNVCFLMVENLRDWLSLDLHKFGGTKNFETKLRSPFMYDAIMLEFRWWEDELEMNFIGKSYCDGYQKKTGVINGTVNDIRKFVFSNDIMPVLFYKGLYDSSSH